MRIGFDAKRLYNNFTGLGNHSRTTIDILTEAYPNHEYWLYTPKVTLNEVTQPYLSKKGCHTVKPTGIVRGSAWRTYGQVEQMKKDGIEVFHGLSNEMPVGLFHSGIASVVTIHDVAFKTFPDMYHWHDKKIYNLKWQYACNHADKIICISECTKRDVLEFYNVPEHKVEVVYQPVNSIYYEPMMEKDGQPPYMLYVGSINSRKNLLGVVKAMELIPKDLRMKLVVVGGGGSYKQKVKEYIAEKGMEKWFVWPDMVVSTDELRRLYTNAELFIYPSFYEGFGLPVVEAQLCGCPVVTSNVSSLPEAGGAWAQKADPSSPEDICEKMTKLLTDTELRQKTIEGGRNYAMETFHPQKLAKQLMGVYEQIKQ
ncbi:MAG: glycosyltransferase family 4 protein [Bacteroidaceae bacterium]|nr:glycosyltransferase family 4 protein [Bacteroidaceae bacterium]